MTELVFSPTLAPRRIKHSYEVANKETIIASGIILVAQNRRRQNMYYRVAIRREGDQLDRPPSWQWKSTALSSLQALLQFLRLYGALPQDQLRVFSSSSRESLEELLAQENKGLSSHSVTATQFLQERNIAVRERAQSASEQRASAKSGW
jgi:hypothetical protein